MKSLLVRLAVVGMAAAVALLAIAQAQRSRLWPVEAVDANAAAAADASFPAEAATDDGRVNPLRSGAAQSDNGSPPREHPLRPAAVDPFSQSGSAAANSPIRPVAAQEPAASADPPAAQSAPSESGPALLPPNAPIRAASPADDRFTAANRYPGPAAGIAATLPQKRVDGDEPGRFRADPAAAPANAMAPVGEEPTALANVGEGDGTGQPGGKQLEGPQTPQLTIQKIAPPEIQVGAPATFRVTVRNTGQAAANNVEVRDQAPRGARLLSSSPPASRGPHGALVWTLGTIGPGQEASVEMQVLPLAEGEMGSVATVRFDANASARSLATQPKLVVQTTGVSRVLIGDRATLSIVVSNPGTGVAAGVVLEERIPQGFQHPAGSELEYNVGDLRPGESRKLQLQLTAVQPGPTTNALIARGAGNLHAEDRFRLEVAAPQLDLAMIGPRRRYLEHQAVYQVAISNPGTAPAQQVELVAQLPSGLKFVSANNSGHYDDVERAVHWRLEELPANERGVVEMVTMPIEPGQQSVKLRGTAVKAAAVEKEQPVVVDGIAAVLFQVSQGNNPIEVGSQTSYEIRVVNQGSKAAANVRLAVLLPPELKALAAEGPSRYAMDNGRILFDALPLLAPKADAVYRVRAQGLQPGDLRVRCQLSTDEMQTPVTKEESTRVYSDQ